MPAALTENLARKIGYSSDFLAIDSELTNTGSVGVVADGRGGIADIDTAATDNNASGLATPKVFDVSGGKGCRLQARLKFSEAGSSTANIFIGFASAAIGSLLQNDGAGPPASWSGAGFLATDGEATLQVVSSVGTSGTLDLLSKQNLNNLSRIARTASDAAYRTLEVDIRPNDQGILQANFLIDNVLVAAHKMIAAASPVAVAALVGVKTGAATEETILLDWIEVEQTR